MNTHANILSFNDLIVSGIVLLLLYFICYIRRSQKYNNTDIRKYFIPAFTCRILGSFLTAGIYQFYYGGGDTFTYYKLSNIIADTFWSNPLMGMELIWYQEDELSLGTWNYIWSEINSLYLTSFLSGSTSYVVRLGGLLSIFFFKSYLAISFFFSFLAFVGCWRLFKTFYYIFPEIHGLLAFAILFIPSVWFWGSGYMKDPIVLSALGFLTHASYKFFITKENRIVNAFIFFISAYLIIGIKIYILISFLPALIFWIMLRKRALIKSKLIRQLTLPFVLIMIIGFGMSALTLVGKFDQKYSMDGVLETAVITSQYIKKVNKVKGLTGGYDLGELEPEVMSFLSFFPKGINVTLFRPYIWESVNPAILITALESFLTLLFTIYIILHVGFFRCLKIIFSSPEVFFCLIFAVIFAGAIGVSTYNFGSLARYKLPCLPFYFTALVITLHLSGKKLHRFK